MPFLFKDDEDGGEEIDFQNDVSTVPEAVTSTHHIVTGNYANHLSCVFFSLLLLTLTLTLLLILAGKQYQLII